MSSERDFYQRRLAEERAASVSAADKVAKDRHLQLANLYFKKLSEMPPEGRSRSVLKMAFSQTGV